MSIESLLEAMVVPSVPPVKAARELPAPPSEKVGSLGSTGSPVSTPTPDQATRKTTNGRSVSQSEERTVMSTENCRNDNPSADDQRIRPEHPELDQCVVPAHFIEHAADGSSPIDPDLFVDVACRGLPITRDWVHQIVICEEDIEDIRKGDLPLACLRAHIEYHLEEQGKWQERRKEIGNSGGIRK